MATKVKNTEVYTDSEGKHIVCKGKLVLIKCAGKPDGNVYVNSIGYKPIIISETEDVKEMDWVFNTKTKEIYQVISRPRITGEFKILALPELFAKAYLQAIADGKIKDGDSVFIECEDNGREEWVGDNHNGEPVWFEEYQVATYYPNGNVKLFPVNKEESWDNIFERLRLFKEQDHNHKYYYEHELIEDFFKTNYNPPTKK